MGRDLPAGTVTFVFTDVEGSTRLLQELGAERYAEALAAHRRILREAFAGHRGVEVDTQGDSFFVAFPTAPAALDAAAQALEELRSGPIRVRIGIHTGTPLLTEEGYVGADVHRAARIAAAGHGGQVLVSASTASLLEPSNTVLLDLGEHRLKDLSAPERIYQLGGGEFSPLKSLYRTNLPIPATPFLGREQELRDVLGLLSEEDVRLLTLTGPGGMGKTRLGLQVAAEAAERFPEGVFWVPLAPLRDPELVLEAAGQALGVSDGFADHVADKSVLLLLDNFEHVVEAAGALSEVLSACPNLQLIVTSRELLQVPGEQVYPVPPLEHEDGEALFLARARAARPDFEAGEAVSELCDRLENLPLALELAAARVRVLSPEQLLERLAGRLDLLKAGRGVDPRQQTLRATIEWSYDLLDEDEQRLFARLAVFRGGCTLEAAEAVCEAELDTLESLVDKSLVRVRDGNRFWMLETIREFAAERLEQSGEADALRGRHAEHVVALAEEAEPSVLGVSPEEWLDRLEREHDNIRAALDQLESSGDTELALRLGGAIWEFWCLRNHFSEGWRRLERLLELDQRATLPRAKALTGSAHLAPQAGADPALFMQRAEEAVELHREMGDPWGIAFAEFEYAQRLNEIGDFAAARPLLEESVRRLREVGDEHRELQAMRNLAWASEQLGDVERHKALYEEVLQRALVAGDTENRWWALSNLALVATREKRHGDAVTLLEEAYRVAQDFGDPGLVDLNLIRFAHALAFADRPTIAVQFLSLGEVMHEELDWTYPGWLIAMKDEATSKAHASLDGAAFAKAWEHGRELTPDEAIELALDQTVT
ncbi:MAG TPA: adenylate/guanylate cyclase domain-containing protein [Gaiellaceae bacterium]